MTVTSRRHKREDQLGRDSYLWPPEEVGDFDVESSGKLNDRRQ